MSDLTAAISSAGVSPLATGAHHVIYQAGALHVLRDAVVLFLIIVFVVGAFVGFLAGRAIGRRERR